MLTHVGLVFRRDSGSAIFWLPGSGSEFAKKADPRIRIQGTKYQPKKIILSKPKALKQTSHVYFLSFRDFYRYFLIVFNKTSLQGVLMKRAYYVQC